MLIQGKLLIDPTQTPQPGYIRVEAGRIVEMEEHAPPTTPDLGSPHHIITPGFIDAHTHFPQIDVIGCDGLELLDWLDAVIYPAEMRWADKLVAERQAAKAVARLVREGTLGCAAYLTSHAVAIPATVNALRITPLRAVVGQVIMDRNAPDALLHQPAADDFQATPRLETSITPRFAIACSPEALAIAGRSAPGRYVQTHLAETPAELRRVAELFPDDEHYTAVYDRFNLLHDKTLLGHCVHLTDQEWELIAARASVAVHCPQANIFLSSGLFNLDKAREHNVRLALGSDIAAGPDIAMPRIARSMIETAKVRKLTVAPNAHIPTPADAWNAITRGNADALGWQDAGRLEVGASADVLLLRVPFDTDTHFIGRLIYTWDASYIAARVLAGRPI
ncbi:MAG: amidohydrolase family protein [Phycisphaerales bacterium]|nr:amidohydrolase family protein [Phycisphaerales bacterium]